MFVISNPDQSTITVSPASLCMFSSSICGDSVRLAVASTSQISMYVGQIPVHLDIESFSIQLRATWHVSLRRNHDCFRYRNCRNYRRTRSKWPVDRAQPAPMCPIYWWLSLVPQLDPDRQFPISRVWSHHRSYCSLRFCPMEHRRCLHQLENWWNEWINGMVVVKKNVEIFTWNAIDIIIVWVVAFLASSCGWFV